MSAHYVEIAPNGLTALGTREILYDAPQTMSGGADAIDFSQGVLVNEKGYELY